MNYDVLDPAGVTLLELNPENTGRISKFDVQVFDPDKVGLKLCHVNFICDGAVIIVKRRPHRKNRGCFSNDPGLLTAHRLIVGEQIVGKDTDYRNISIVGHSYLNHLSD